MEIKLHCYHHRHRWFGDHISIISLANGPGWTRIDKNPSNLFLEREEEREKKTNYVGTLHTQHDTTKYSNHQQIVHTRTIRSLPFVVFFSLLVDLDLNLTSHLKKLLFYFTVQYCIGTLFLLARERIVRQTTCLSFCVCRLWLFTCLHPALQIFKKERFRTIGQPIRLGQSLLKIISLQKKWNDKRPFYVYCAVKE